MKILTLPVITLALLMTVPVAAQEKDAATPTVLVHVEATDTDALMAKDGQKIVVYGTTKGSGKSGSGTNFVNFDGADFYLVTFKSDLTEFKEGEPADLYDGKRLAVTGVVSIYQGKPQFKLTDPETVQILEADAEFPPKSGDTASDEKAKTPAPEKKTGEDAKKPAPEEGKKAPPVDPKKYFK